MKKGPPFKLRLPADIYEDANLIAGILGISMNQFLSDAVGEVVNHFIRKTPRMVLTMRYAREQRRMQKEGYEPQGPEAAG